MVEAIQEGPHEVGQKAIKTAWPVTEGLTAGTTKQTRKKFLHPTKKSLLKQNEIKGIY